MSVPLAGWRLGTLRRFREFIAAFAGAIGEQVRHSSKFFTHDPLEVREVRHDSAGAWALLILMVYAENIQLPYEVLEHPAMRRIDEACNDWILIQSDMLSCRKEGKGASDSRLDPIVRRING